MDMRVIIAVGVVLDVIGGVLYLIGHPGPATLLVVLGAVGIVVGALLLGRQRRLAADRHR